MLVGLSSIAPGGKPMLLNITSGQVSALHTSATDNC